MRSPVTARRWPLVVTTAALVAGSVVVAVPSTASAATGYHISGHVTLGTKLAGAGAVDVTYITASSSGLFPSETTTDSTGAFSFDVPTNTRFILQVANTGPGNFAPYTSSPLGGPSCSVEDWIDPTADISGLDITLPVGGEISGTVTDAAGKPLADVDPIAQDINSCSTIDSAYPKSQVFAPATGADGKYRVRNLPVATSFQVQFYAGGETNSFVRQYLGEAPWAPYGGTYAVTAGKTLTKNMTLFAGGTLTGSITCTCDRAAFEPSEVQVDLEGLDPVSRQWVRYTEAVVTRDGDATSYSANYLTPGSYRVTTSSTLDGFTTSSSAPVTVVDAVSTVQNVRLASAATSNPGVSPAVNSFITALYRDFLGRTPSAPEVKGWAANLAAGAPRTSIAVGFADSDEYRLIRIDAAYHSILWRGPDAAGRAYWLDQMHRGVIRTEDIEKQFYASQEYVDNRGGTQQSWVGAIYLDLLKRNPSVSDISFWSRAADQQGRVAITVSFWQSQETAERRVSAMYASYLGRTPDQGGLAAWTGYDLANGDSVTRSSLTSSDEYFTLAAKRFPVAP
ncbi:hypothetical protein B7R54_12465 [Subtercola boreus]|uniref:DUF4214 domain-containing protein n=1 Tax=Subtercola boreus TaxID=120213 RepID=A0A3E0VIY5_9MICO|nr:DUF4214 domain-containing protein [Subtercola boreus]RFA09924.1 hypothetical protein B7R54_12465 [Subtercola boreus]TQL52937.1 uncharacterized protein DUF4214 [Subtercola boreus]